MTTIIRVNKIQIGTSGDEGDYYEWTDNFQLKFNDIDPWIDIPIPKGEHTVHQHILSPHVDGELRCKDLAALITALFTTDIDSVSNVAIDQSDYNTKHKVSYFYLELEQSDGDVQQVYLTGFTVRNITVEDIAVGKEATFIVKFHADLVTYYAGES